MHKNAKKVERKIQTKIGCHHTWLLHGKSCPSRLRFPRSFLKPQANPVEGQSLQQKREKRRKRKDQKKFQKSKSPKDLDHFLVQKPQNFDFCACPSQNVAKRNASGKKAKLT